jgi:hypothetical protein
MMLALYTGWVLLHFWQLNLQEKRSRSASNEITAAHNKSTITQRAIVDCCFEGARRRLQMHHERVHYILYASL